MNAPSKASMMHMSLTDAAAAVADGSVTALALAEAAFAAFEKVDP